MSIPNPYCPVCRHPGTTHWAEARDYEYFSTEDNYQYYHCSRCGTLFINPIPADQLHRIYPSNYYSFVNGKKNPVTRIKEWLDRRFFRSVLRQIPGENLHVLDVGGGTGWMLDQLKKTDPRIRFTQVVDIDQAARQIAESNGHAYYEGTMESFSTEKKFHLILMLNLVEHVADPLAVLQKAGTLLAPEGTIVIKTPNTDSWDARLFRKTYWGGLHCPRHWVIFSEKSFRLLAGNAGLAIRELTYTQGAPFWAFSIITALSRKKIIHTSAEKPVIFHPLFAPLSAFFALFDFIRRPFSRTSQLFIRLGHPGNNRDRS
ncbi:MAG: class I SAM-dependent methyltransferase [Chitinophagaceae bacterium]|nr:class I SAM-dependent methyltransferase [Chitinophagaceae bacterium]